jgi:DnaJ-class molecular chaperone
MALVERVCDVCKGVGRLDSCMFYCGVRCSACEGSGTVTAPDDEECRAMIEAVHARLL